MTYNLFIMISGEDHIARFSMDPDSGALDPRENIALPGSPAPVAISPDRQFMYVAQRAANKLTSFRISATDGSLAPLGTIPLRSDPCYLAMDQTGQFLLGAYYLAEKASVHRIGANGAALDPPVEWRTTGRGAHCLQTDRSNRFAFVPHIEGNGAPNAIFQFRFNPETGQLDPNVPDRFATSEMLGPRHFCFHPALDMVYVSNEQGCSVSVLNFDPIAGTLSHRQTLTTLPAEWDGANKCSQIRMTQDGRFLYAPNRGHDSIACFTVDKANGLLTENGHVAAEPVPRAFDIDPGGHFLLSAGLESGRLTVYRIDGNNGGLERITTHEVGARPMWVTILPAS